MRVPPQSSKSWMTILVLKPKFMTPAWTEKVDFSKKNHLKTKNENRIKNIFTKQDAAHEPESSHVGHVFFNKLFEQSCTYAPCYRTSAL